MTPEEREAYLDRAIDELDNIGKPPPVPPKLKFQWIKAWRIFVVLTCPIWVLPYLFIFELGKDALRYIKTGRFEK